MYKFHGQKKEKIPQKDKNSINPHPFALLVPIHINIRSDQYWYYANTRIGVPAVLSPIIKNKKGIIIHRVCLSNFVIVL